MLDNKQLVIITITCSVLLSAFVGAGAGFLVTQNAAVQSWYRELLPESAMTLDQPTNTVERRTVQVEEQSAVIDAVEAVSPAVVSVIVTKDLPKLERFYYNPFEGDYFGNFFGDEFLVPGTRQNGTERREVGGGTGFIVSADGLIVTNKHVVLDEDADYSVLLNDERTFDAAVLARDPINDLAILKIDAADLPTVTLGDSSVLKAGQSVVAIGNALGEFRNTVSVGVISGLARSITAGGGVGFAEELTNVIQTDASINPGNSGGPLLDIAGNVVGINTAVAAGAQGIGFAIPINEVKQTIESVKENGRIVRPYLGIRYVMITETMAETNNLSVSDGALIVRGQRPDELAVVPGSPADKAGLEENDIITSINDTKLTSDMVLAKVVAQYKPGDTIKLTVLHDGEEKTVQVTLGEFGQ